MKKAFLLLFTLFLAGATFATHVVGGSIKVDWVAMNQYKVTVTVYRDCHPGSSSMPSTLNLGIYQKGTNLLVGSTHTLSSPVITANLPFGDDCYTPTDLCVDQGVFVSSTITLPNYAPGYYLSTAIYARNNIIDNLDNPGTQGMTFYAEIPDPALGQNSSPQWGPYPEDAYLCIGNTKDFDFGVTDPDGDSLVYHLVDPLYSSGSTSTPGPYTPVTWNTAGGFSLANICGGAPPMSVDPVTGVISASPAAAGVYVFAVQVEEWRGGVKIGETRNDVQYSALNCVFDSAPDLYVGDSDTLTADLGQTFCFDIVVLDEDLGDTLALSVLFPETEELGAVLFLDESNTYNYYDPAAGWLSTTTSGNTLYDPTYDLYYDTTSVALRYCWETECGDELVSAPYEVELLAFSIGCSGFSDTISKTIYLDVQPIENGFDYMPNVFTPNGDGHNDELKLVGIADPCYDSVLIEIYNRWGQLVFEDQILPEDGREIIWDGKNKGGNLVAEGTYFLWIRGQYGGEIIEETTEYLGFDAGGNPKIYPLIENFPVTVLHGK